MRLGHRIAIALAGLGILSLAGCRAPGKPGPGPEIARPDQVLDFDTLYKENCAACHGADGHHGNAVSLANPVYLAVAGPDVLRKFTAQGGPGELMPAFARTSGGELTDQQVDVLVNGIEQRWGRPGLLAGQNPPPYATVLTGNPAAGQVAFTTYCARCHSDSAPAAAKAESHFVGSVTGASFLALISDQSLRTTILAGRPDEGMPDWRGFGPQPLTDQQVTDIVAWLASQRQGTPAASASPHP